MKEKTKKQNTLWRVLILSVLLLLCYCFTSFPFSFLSGVSFDYIAAFAAATAFFASPMEAAIFAFVAGLFKDITVGSVIGFHAVIYMLFAIVVSMLVVLLVRQTFLNGVISGACMITASKLFYYFIYNVLFQRGGRIALFWHVVVPSVLLTVVFFPLMFLLIKKIYKVFSGEGVR